LFPSKEVTSLTRGHPSCQVRFQMHWGSTGNILLNCSPLIRGTKKVYTTKLTSSWKATSTTLLSDKISEVLRKYILLNLPPHERQPLLHSYQTNFRGTKKVYTTKLTSSWKATSTTRPLFLLQKGWPYKRGTCVYKIVIN
jgi:hypothetical protein